MRPAGTATAPPRGAEGVPSRAAVPATAGPVIAWSQIRLLPAPDRTP